MRLKGDIADNTKALHEVQTRGLVQQQSSEIDVICIESTSVSMIRSDDITRSKTMSATLNWELYIMELFTRFTEKYTKKCSN